MNLNKSHIDEIAVFAQVDNDSPLRLTVLHCVNEVHSGIRVLVQLPDVKADPQAITDMQRQMDAQAGVMRAQQAEIEQWKKRFDALLFAKGGAA